MRFRVAAPAEKSKSQTSTPQMKPRAPMAALCTLTEPGAGHHGAGF